MYHRKLEYGCGGSFFDACQKVMSHSTVVFERIEFFEIDDV